MADYVVTIAGQPITLGGVNASPNWAAGQVEFNQAVASALSSVVGTFDIPPQQYTMVSNSNTDVSITNLSFSSTAVRSAQVSYAITRLTDSANEAQAGTLELIYNAAASSGSKWLMSRTSTGSSSVMFAVDDDGQISFSCPALSGSNFSGNIVFKASTLQQSYT